MSHSAKFGIDAEISWVDFILRRHQMRRWLLPNRRSIRQKQHLRLPPSRRTGNARSEIVDMDPGNPTVHTNAPVRKPPQFESERLISIKMNWNCGDIRISNLAEHMPIADISMKSEIPLMVAILPLAQGTREK